MRARNIKPGFFKNDDLAEIEPMGRLLFVGLWMMADREGRLIDRPKRIKGEVFPYDNCDVDALLNELQKWGFIIRYEVDGVRYIQVTNFKEHQNPHAKEAPSSIPAPDKHQTSTVQAPDKHSTNPAESLLLNPDSLNPESQSIRNIDDVSEIKASEAKRSIAIEMAKVCRKYGIKAQPQNPLLHEMARQGVELSTLESACQEAKSKKATSIRYVMKILESWAVDTKRMRVNGAKPPDSGAGTWGEFASEYLKREKREVIDVDSTLLG